MAPTDPQPLFTPEADFNQDGSTDIAISGIYTLADGKRYFLLVSAPPKKLFFEEYDAPVFLHLPGTTGEGDPGDQAFSITHCAGCAQGADFYWDKKTGRFRQKPWAEKLRRQQKMVTVAAVDVPAELADKALQVAGKLPDVVAFTEGVKKAGKVFGVRVEYTDPSNADAPLRVRIFEKRKSREVLYDWIVVDVQTMKVVRRGKGKGSGK